MNIDCLKEGNLVTVKYKSKKKKSKTFAGKVLKVYEKFFLVSNGKYRQCFLLADIKTGEIEVKINKSKAA